MCTNECNQDTEYICGDVCAKKGDYCSCGGVTLTEHGPAHCCLAPDDACKYDYIDTDGSARDLALETCALVAQQFQDHSHATVSVLRRVF